MAASSTDRIDKQIEIQASPARVWRALTEFREFGEWFRVKLEGPFVPGRQTRGKITYPGYEHLTFEVQVKQMEAEKYFSFTWHPYAIEPGVDYSKETPTLVEFHLSPTPTGTLLRVTESGFDAIPAARRAEAFRMNSGGWEEQVKNINAYATRS